jgi:hypothetical protein
MTLKAPNYTRDRGIAIMMEHPIPGSGGRHRQTLSYGQSPDPSLSPRQTLAKEVRDLYNIYSNQKLYTPEIRQSLQQIIDSNRLTWSGVFEKEETFQ